MVGRNAAEMIFFCWVAAYLTFDPGLISPSGLISRTEPLPSSAANNMPSDSTPLSLRGSRLATNTTKLPREVILGIVVLQPSADGSFLFAPSLIFTT